MEDDEAGRHPFSIYLGLFREKKPGAAAAALRDIDCPVLGRALTRLLDRARAAKCPEGRLLVECYAGETTVTGAYGRMHDPDGHLHGRGGARRFWRWLTSPVIRKYFDFHHRLLARPAHPRAANQLEITVAQLASVAINEVVSIDVRWIGEVDLDSKPFTVARAQLLSGLENTFEAVVVVDLDSSFAPGGKLEIPL